MCMCQSSNTPYNHSKVSGLHQLYKAFITRAHYLTYTTTTVLTVFTVVCFYCQMAPILEQHTVYIPHTIEFLVPVHSINYFTVTLHHAWSWNYTMGAFYKIGSSLRIMQVVDNWCMMYIILHNIMYVWVVVITVNTWQLFIFLSCCRLHSIFLL